MEGDEGGDRAWPFVPHNFSDEAMDTKFHFQILRLPNQVYMWVACNGARMGNLCVGVPTRFDSMPSVSVLLGGGGAGDVSGAGMARRLSLKLKTSVLMASGIPPNSPLLEGFAERRLLQELKALGILSPGPKDSTIPNNAPSQSM
eukprot:TRINITY_DN23936_c0_g1_i1.p1 TRINITY_DN23936_c0_g1~~TRINITY_DN23936_c0_g1_i1.p1  ORF type:complete len:145 (+),score=18.95 TRINITY_DN23936_c0_g1_i1:399-833(+)